MLLPLYYFLLPLWRRQWQPIPVLLPGNSHGWRSLVGCSPWCHEESDTTERLHFHFSLSCIGEGNGNPRQCSCLENPRDGGAWWATVYGVAQSRTQLKRLSSSNSLYLCNVTNFAWALRTAWFICSPPDLREKMDHFKFKQENYVLVLQKLAYLASACGFN